MSWQATSTHSLPHIVRLWRKIKQEADEDFIYYISSIRRSRFTATMATAEVRSHTGQTNLVEQIKWILWLFCPIQYWKFTLLSVVGDLSNYLCRFPFLFFLFHRTRSPQTRRNGEKAVRRSEWQRRNIRWDKMNGINNIFLRYYFFSFVCIAKLKSNEIWWAVTWWVGV